MISYNQPVFTISREPFVAGTIVVRNQMRVLKQRDRRRKWEHLICRLRLFGSTPAKTSFGSKAKVDKCNDQRASVNCA